MIDTAKKWLSSKFEMKNMDKANYVLSVKIVRNRVKRFLGLPQKTYIKRMLKRYHMQDSKLIDIPINKRLSLSHDICPKTQKKKIKIPYANAICSLMYAMMCTHPDIFNDVHTSRHILCCWIG